MKYSDLNTDITFDLMFAILNILMENVMSDLGIYICIVESKSRFLLRVKSFPHQWHNDITTLARDQFYLYVVMFMLVTWSHYKHTCNVLFTSR